MSDMENLTPLAEEVPQPVEMPPLILEDVPETREDVPETREDIPETWEEVPETEETVSKTPARPKKKKRRAGKIIILLLCLVVLPAVLLAAFYFGFVRPYDAAHTAVPVDGRLMLAVQENGSVTVDWARDPNVDYYTLTLWRAGEEEPFFRQEVRDSAPCLLPELPQQELVVQVRSYKAYKTLIGEKIREGDSDLVYRGELALPKVENVQWEVDADTDRLSVALELLPGQVVRMIASLPGGQSWSFDLTQERNVFTFGQEDGLPMPGWDEAYSFSFETWVEQPRYRFDGTGWDGFNVVREDLLGTVLELTCTDEGHNQFSLTWNETKGEHYEVQRYNAYRDTWETLVKIPKDGERFYDTGHLSRYSTFRFRVVAVGGQTLPDSEFAATPDETEVKTGASLVYSTVWPTRDLEVYKAPDKAEVIGTAKVVTAFCVLDEEEGLFKVRFGDGYGYIDSNYCMINLPEYMGDLVSYNITNSEEAIYMVHDYEIEDVTGKLLTGYEKVKLDEYDYLVPLLYPTAIKLEKAAIDAKAAGYRLLIYDSYRPGKTSNFLEEACSKMLEKLIPEETYTEEPAKDMPDIPIKGTESDPAMQEGYEEVEGAKPIEYLTYKYLMTDNGRMGLGYFIAGFGSRHNYGVALDLTLEHITNREEVEMQSAIHDLSHYSELGKNNKEANTLTKIMTGAGFGGLVSEWWHFQDNDALNNLGLTAVWEGVSPECWMADDYGWRYRFHNGSYFKSCTATIGGVQYVFDDNGYVVTPESGTP